jgi:hypothetical protein
MRSRSPNPFGDEQKRSVALALEQRVGGDRRAHLHRFDGAGRDRCTTLQAQQIADALDGSVAILFRVLRQQLVRDDFTGWLAADDIGERAATVDPELPHGFFLDCQLMAAGGDRRIWRSRTCAIAHVPMRFMQLTRPL